MTTLAAVARWLRTPKGQLLIIFAALLAIAGPAAGGRTLLPNVLAAIVPACLIDGIWISLSTRRLRFPISALLSGLIVLFVLSSNESWLVVAWASSLATLSKRILRTGREHIFNPAALALLWPPVVFGSGESWWGALGDMSWFWLPILLLTGIFLTDRLNKFPVVLTFLATYFTIFTVASTLNPHGLAEMFREPFVQAALFLAFFMLTDPPTSPNRYVDQFWFGMLAAITACAAQLAGLGQIYLLAGVLTANAVLALVRASRRESAARKYLTDRPRTLLVRGPAER